MPSTEVPVLTRAGHWAILGIGLRLHGLETHSLWFDEACTVHLAEAEDPVEALRGDRQPPLTVLALRGWIAAFGEEDATLRLLPALAACASLILFWILARAWLPGPGWQRRCSPLLHFTSGTARRSEDTPSCSSPRSFR